MYYLQSRYYDPALKRFINADGFVSTGQTFTGYNMFSYCLNDPVNSADSEGSFAITAASVVGGAIFGAISGALGAVVSGDSVVAGAAIGAASGAASVVFQAGAIGSMAISAISSIYEQKANNPTGKIQWRKVVGSAVAGRLSYGIGHIGDKIIKSVGDIFVAKAVVKADTEALSFAMDITADALTTPETNSAPQPRRAPNAPTQNKNVKPAIKPVIKPGSYSTRRYPNLHVPMLY